MKKCNLWEMLLNRFFILFHLTKTYERPSEDKVSSKERKEAVHKVKAVVLPYKETVMTDDYSGYTKTKLQVQEVYEGSLREETVLEMCEPYYEGYYGGRKCMIVYEDYEPLIIGKSYTFSLVIEENQMIQKKRHMTKDHSQIVIAQCKDGYHKVS